MKQLIKKSKLLFLHLYFQICVADDSRNSAWVSFDGRKRQELHLGDW